ncbi:MAG: hypothetical protein J6Q82_04840 [Clostridia bacterium]|nr:hypothetical protein [Clostridia bacterium]
MTWKKFWKHVNALLHDNRTVLREGEDVEDWDEVQCKQREIESEQQRKEQEILATWFLREEYVNAGWFKRLLLRIEFVFRDTRGESHIPQIPKHIRMEIARCLLPDIIAYYESEQGQKEFAEWKAQQEAAQKGKERGRVTSLRNRVNLIV